MNRSLDVVAVNQKTLAVRLIGNNVSERNADAIICMAIMRNGTETEFFAEVPAGSYKDGDQWRADDES